jgi:hypothetical protein
MAGPVLCVLVVFLIAACGSAAGSLSALESAAAGAGAGAGVPSAVVGASAPAALASAPDGVSAKPSAPNVTITAKPTVKPTAAPTAKPTAAPTARPTPTPIVATKSCKTSDGAITNKYPIAWRTVEDEPQFNCMFFNNVPIVINAETGYPIAPIHVVPNDALSFNAAVIAATDTKVWRSVSKTPMKIGGLPAVLVVAIANGSGSYPRDTERYGWIVDWGPNGIIVLQTTGPEGDTRLAANKLVLDGMAKTIVIKANP